MKRRHWFLVCSLSLLLLGGAQAFSQEDAKANDTRAVDRKLYDALRDVINHGADVYNRGDWAGCHRLYAGALMTSQAMLGHRPELQKAIAEGLKAAEAEPVISEKAFVLRRVLDKVRADLRGDVTPPPPPQKTTAKGTVTLDEKPLAGADVQFIDAKGASKKAKTGPDGTFSISDLAPGAYKVTVDGKDVPAKFKDPSSSPLVATVKAGDNKPFTYDLKSEPPPPPPTTVKGKVTVDGKPLADGSVLFFDKDNKSTEGKVKDGSYKVEGLKPGDYKAAVRGTGVPAKYTDPAKADLPVSVKSGDNTQDFNLKPDAPPPPPATSLEGKVTVDGKPLADGTVTLLDKDNKPSEGKVKDGSYKVEGLKPGDYKVVIKGTGVPAKYTDPAKSDETLSVKSGKNSKDFNLKEDKPTPPPPPPAASVSGKVTLDGKPLGEGEVILVDNEGKTVKSAKIDKDGNYRVEGVPQGGYKVGVDAKGIPPKYKVPTTSGFTVDVKSSNVTRDLLLEGDKPTPPQGSVKGKVTIDGKPLAAGTITLVDKDGKSTEGKITDGSFEVKDLKPGDYKVVVKGAGVPADYTDAGKTELTVSVKDADTPLPLDLKNPKPTPPTPPTPPSPPPAAKDASVTGKVTFKGKPLAKGDVVLVDEKGKTFKAKIEADGSFSLDKLQPGTYKVTIDADGIAAKYKEAATSGLELKLTEGENKGPDLNLQE